MLGNAQGREEAGASSTDQRVPDMDVVLLGVGNILLTDEGIGVRVVEEIERHFDFSPPIRIIDGGTSGMELLDDLAGVDHLLIVDAVKSGQPAGSLVRLAGDAVPKFFTTKLSPHQVGLSDVLATLQIMEEPPGETVIIGVEPASLAMAMELSPTVEAALSRTVEATLDELRRMGVSVAPKKAA